MKLLWEVDDRTRVEAEFGGFGKEVVRVNGRVVHERRSVGSRSEIGFNLPDERSAVLGFKPRLIGKPLVDLRVAGQLYTETGKHPLKCAQCRAVVKTNDRFCGKCGSTQPSAEYRVHEKQVAEATGAIKALGVLYAIFSVGMYLVTKRQAAALLGKLSGVDARLRASEALASLNRQGAQSETPSASDVSFTVGQLREQLLWEPWGVLIINGILAVVMLGLALWGKRAPLPAVLAATATYAVVNVANAIAEPMTIAQGLLLKIVMIGFLVKGIKAALALRTAQHA